jgi:hypothetical protein
LYIAGAALLIGILGSSIRVVLLPRGVRGRWARTVFITVRLLFKLRIWRRTSYEVRDRLLSFYGPLALLALLATWVLGVVIAFTGMMWAAGVHPLRAAFAMSGSSIVTLGFATPHGLPQTLLVIAESALGLFELALLITFLPNIYSDFYRREREVTKIRVEAGQPPEGVYILIRLFRLERLDVRTEVWQRFLDWFVEVENSHVAFPALPFFRSLMPQSSWVTAAGAVLDGAALAASCLDAPRDLEAELLIRSGYLCLRRIAEILQLPFDDDPAPTDPIAVTRTEFDEVWARMRDVGLPLKPDQDKAWRDFAGWRVNYDEPLIRLATVTEAPIAPWSSDRGLVLGRRPTLIERIRL